MTYNLGEGFSIGGACPAPNVPPQNDMGFGTGDHAEVYTGGLKYDANNIYLAAQYSQTYNATRLAQAIWVGLTKRRTSKWLLSTSSTSACASIRGLPAV
jgi:outer membrane pore protein C